MPKGMWVFSILLAVASVARATIQNVVPSGGGSVSLSGYNLGPGETVVSTSSSGGFSYPSTIYSGSAGDRSSAYGDVSIGLGSTATTLNLSFSGSAGPGGIRFISGTSGSFNVSASEKFTLPLDSDVSVTFTEMFGVFGGSGESITGGPGNSYSFAPTFTFNNSGPGPVTVSQHLLAGTYMLSGGASGDSHGDTNTASASGTIGLTLVKEFAAVPEPSMTALLLAPTLMLRRRR